MLYLAGELVDVDNNPATNQLDFNSTLRFLIGRANTDMRREHFTDGVLDNVEFWERTRSVLKSLGYLNEGQRATPSGISVTKPSGRQHRKSVGF